MEVGLIFKWGKPVLGREQQAIDLFAEVKEWIEDQYKKEVITYYEPFLYATGDLEAEMGFWVIKGERDKLWKWREDETFRWLTMKAAFVMDHFQVEWLTVGEGIPEEIERSVKLLADLAPVG